MEPEWFFLGTAALLCTIFLVLAVIWAFQTPAVPKKRQPRTDLQKIKEQITSGSKKPKPDKFYNSPVEEL